MSPQTFSDLKVGGLYRLLKKPYVHDDDRGVVRHSPEPGMIFIPFSLLLPGPASVFELAKVNALIGSDTFVIVISPNDYEPLEGR